MAKFKLSQTDLRAKNFQALVSTGQASLFVNLLLVEERQGEKGCRQLV